MWVFRRQVDSRTHQPLTPWTIIGTRCETAASQGPTPAQIRQLLLSDSRFLPAPVSRTRIDPRSGRTVVHAEVVVSADTPERYATDVTLLGIRVHLDLRPQRWTWDFGDGTTATTQSPGRPYPSHEISHRYATRGDVLVAVRVTWGGTFTVGGRAYPIDGTADVQGPATPLHVGQARAELVGGQR